MTVGGIMARPAIEAGGHHLTISLPPEPIHLLADPTRLAQVFGNLLSNSAKYTKPGGRIRLDAERQGEELVVSVRDTGIGIPEDALGRIFDMFAQVDRSIERTTGGLGIGLALVKGLVEMHGGTVAAESDGPGQGSCFVVRLPILKGDLDQVDPVLPQVAPRHPWRRRILVVDDNRDSAHSMATLLKLLGNEVQAVHDGFAAVEAAERFRPDVVIMDVGMPRMNGYEATRRIRAQPWGKDMLVIALTGWGQESDRAASEAAGCNAHLVKPLNVWQLEPLLAGLQRGRAAADELERQPTQP